MLIVWRQDPSLQLSRLILHNSDPHDSLMSREALLKDNQVFNLPLKGLGPKHEYPGPRVNQASSGRCWLFATSEANTCHEGVVADADAS